MKTCPICHARAFDDAEVCFGCLHRFAEEGRPASALQAARQSDGGGKALSEEDYARVQGVAAAVRAAGARQPAPCPFSGGRAALPAEHAAPAMRGEGTGAGAAPALEAAPFDGRGWIVRFEFPGLSPVAGPAGAFAQPIRGQGAKAEGIVVSLRPSIAPDAAADAPARLGRGIHARAGERPLLEATAAEGS